MGAVNEVTYVLQDESGAFFKEMAADLVTYEDKAKEIEEYITTAFNHLAYVHYLMGDPKANVEFVLDVVGAFMVAYPDGVLPKGVAEPYVFIAPLLEAIANGEVGGDVQTEEIVDEETEPNNS